LVLGFLLILLLSPYFSGADFGLFKVPAFSKRAKKVLKIASPIVFVLCVLCFVPIVTLEQPNIEGAERYAARGFQTLDERRWGEAEAAFVMAEKLAPKTVEWNEKRSQWLYNAGLAAERQSNWKAAEDHYGQAAKIFPEDPQIQVKLGYAFYGQEKWRDAEAAFSRALSLASSWPLWGGHGATKEECERLLQQTRDKMRAR
jgi:tetratricopeptide (TPR) repeat protein